MKMSISWSSESLLESTFPAAETNELYIWSQEVIERRYDPFIMLSDEQFLKFFRMRKHRARELVDMLRLHLPIYVIKTPPSLEIKVLVAVAYFAHGSHLKAAQMGGIWQSLVNKYINQIIEALSSLPVIDAFIKFPSTLEKLEKEKFKKYDFPGVIGCIDCIQVDIVKPILGDVVDVANKRTYTINVHVICDSEGKIIDFRQWFMGSSNDSTVLWRTSVPSFMKDVCKKIPDTYFILGNSMYPLTPWLMIPVGEVDEESPETSYDKAHARCRDAVTECLSALRNRWRCLVRILNNTPLRCSKMIVSCLVLHNFCMQEPMPEDEVVIPRRKSYRRRVVGGVKWKKTHRGKITRAKIIRTFFT